MGNLTIVFITFNQNNLKVFYSIFKYFLSIVSIVSILSTVFLGAKKRLYKRLRRLVGWSVRPSVCPHDAITWKTGYVAIASRGGEGRGN
jgi:hypothetical protein